MSPRFVVIPVAVCLALAGCTMAAPEIDLPEQNIAQWVMPLDRYTLDDIGAADYAENLLMRPCIEDRGFAWDVPWRDIDADRRETSNVAGVRLFTVELAARYGYRTSPSNDGSREAWLRFTQQELSPAHVQAVEACVVEARKQLPRLPGSAQLGFSLGVSASAGAAEDPDVVAAAAAWRECMADIGIPDLPETPLGMPTPSLAQRFGLDVLEAPAGAEEIEVATADARCRQTSGYAETLYREQWDREVVLVGENADALQRIVGVIEANRIAIAEVISSHAPAPPA